MAKRTYMTDARQKRNISLTRLAELVGSGKGTLSNIENGRRNPGFALAMRISKALDIDPQLLAQDGVNLCPGCGEEVLKGAVRCSGCGTKL